jgi:hypothetical protein
VSRIFSAFHAWWENQDTGSTVFHEHELYTKSAVDFLFCKKNAANYAEPTLIVEFVTESTTPFHTKLHQLRQEARNAFQLFPETSAGCVMGVLLDPVTFAFEVHVMREVDDKNSVKFTSVSLIQDGTEQQLSNLLALMCVWCKQLQDAESGKYLPTIPEGARHSKSRYFYEGEQKFVDKEYDYRGVDREEAQRRQHQHSIEYLPGAKYVVDAKDIHVIRYPFIEGSHYARNTAQFKTVFDQLQKIHSDGFVFGDLHLFNIIFHSEGDAGATLIDFDYARPEGALYIGGFATDIATMGARHRDASSGAPMKKEHDWFSLAAAMALFEPKNESDKDAYAKLVESVETGQWIEHKAPISLGSFADEFAPSLVGTGSPCRAAPTLPPVAEEKVAECVDGMQRLILDTGIQRSERCVRETVS